MLVFCFQEEFPVPPHLSLLQTTHSTAVKDMAQWSKYLDGGPGINKYLPKCFLVKMTKYQNFLDTRGIFTNVWLRWGRIFELSTPTAPTFQP